MDVNRKKSDQFRQGYLYAIRLLTANHKSTHELETRLRNKGYSEATIYEVLDKLRTQGILNDQRFVQELVQSSIEARRYGRRRISFELKKKGVAPDQIVQSLEGYSEGQERAAALSLAKERLTKLSKVPPDRRKKRIYDFLASRGFDYELCREVVAVLEIKSHENF